MPFGSHSKFFLRQGCNDLHLYILDNPSRRGRLLEVFGKGLTRNGVPSLYSTSIRHHSLRIRCLLKENVKTFNKTSHISSWNVSLQYPIPFVFQKSVVTSWIIVLNWTGSKLRCLWAQKEGAGLAFVRSPNLPEVTSLGVNKYHDAWISSYLTIGSYVSVRSSRYEARGKFGEHERCTGSVAESNSSFLSALQTSQVLHISMNAQLRYEPIVL